MKKLLIPLLLLCAALPTQAQEQSPVEGYQFKDLISIPATSVKDQSRSGTCWCFSALAYLESEILRAGGAETELSVMWIVRNIYFEKAVKYIRLHGSLNLAVGGQAHDVTDGIAKYGIVPQEVYPGLNYGYDKPNFYEIDAVVKAYVDAVIESCENLSAKGREARLSTAWQAGLNGILDAYFGSMPEKFTYKGKEYTPQSYAASLPIKMEDYVELASFTHHPFYTQFVLEVPDNWAWGKVYNVPLDELMSTIDYALEKGYSIEWATDVSEKGFDRTKAIGIIPAESAEGLEGTEAERWGRMSDKEKEKALYSFDKPVRERTITQQMRQEAFDNYQTTDDHGMQITGTAVDQQGNPFYKVKNSWDVRPPYAGYFYFSRPFVAYKTISILVNKNAIPADVRRKLGL